MGLMDNLGKGLLGQIGGMASGRDGNMLGAIANMLSNRDIGGLSGLTQLFAQRGHGDVVNSWISRGENRPISPDAIQDVLGQDRIREVADSAGVSPQEASHGLSSLLPQLVDKMTPDGELPEQGASSDMLSQLAGRFLKRH